MPPSEVGDPATVSSAEERRSLLHRLVETAGPTLVARQTVHADDSWSYVETETAPGALRRLIREAIEETAADGEVVIVAHAASFALADRPSILRVLVTGSPDRRARRLADAGGDEVVKASDKARADYLRRFYGVDRESPTHYDVVINSDWVTPAQAAEMLIAAARTA